MAIPSFNPHFHIQNLHEAIVHHGYSHKITTFNSQRGIVLKAIKQTVEQLDAKIQDRNIQDLTQLSQSTKKAVDEFANKMFFSNKNPHTASLREKAEFKKMQDDLYHKIEVVLRALELNNLAQSLNWDVKKIIRNEEGRYLFKFMALAGDPWAIGHLNEMLQLEESLATALATEILTQTDAIELNPDAICTFFHIINNLDPSKTSTKIILDRIAEPAIERFNPNSIIQNLLFVYASEVTNQKLYNSIWGKIVEFSSPDYIPKVASRLLNRLNNFHESIQLKEEDSIFAEWSDYNLKLRLCSKLILVEKDRRFIEFATQSLRLGPSDFSPSSKYFPNAKGLIIGQTKGWEIFASDIAQQLVPDCDVSIYSPKCREQHLEGWSDLVIPIEGDEQATHWIQDSCLMALNKNTYHEHVLFPRFTHPSEMSQQHYNEVRMNRVCKALTLATGSPVGVFETPTIPVLGRIATRGEQLMLLDQLLQNSLSTKSLQNTMTFFEGGNLLPGVDAAGNPYVIVGADLIAMNRKFLISDIKALGLTKNSEDQFIFKESSNEESDDDLDFFNLTDEEVCAFIAKDLGLESVDQIHVVEQPATFHLDMGMAILGNKNGKKTVILNHAIQAADVYREMVEINKITVREDLDFPNLMNQLTQENLAISKFEDVAEAQLKQQGFSVVRVPGRFRSLEAINGTRSDTVNFFNFVCVKLRKKEQPETTRPVVIALGCEDPYQEMFKKMFNEQSDMPNADIQFIFLDAKYSEASLKGRGGISCMTKILEGELI